MVIDKPSLNAGLAGAPGVGSINPGNAAVANQPAKPGEAKKPGGFGDILKTELGKSNPTQSGLPGTKFDGVKFSQHALERMANRGITFKPEEMARLNEAIGKAEQKGSRETLVLMGENALIVSVKNKTVVTAMDREAMKENIFTNIDSTVIL